MGTARLDLWASSCLLFRRRGRPGRPSSNNPARPSRSEPPTQYSTDRRASPRRRAITTPHPNDTIWTTGADDSRPHANAGIIADAVTRLSNNWNERKRMIAQPTEPVANRAMPTIPLLHHGGLGKLAPFPGRLDRCNLELQGITGESLLFHLHRRNLQVLHLFGGQTPEPKLCVRLRLRGATRPVIVTED